MIRKYILFFILILSVPGISQTDSNTAVTEPGIRPTLLWGATQLIPSPHWSVASDGDAHFGARWQVTPVLYSFGINRRLSPWRSLVVEPMTRYNGSVELFITPEYIPSLPENWLLRGGVRAYMPLYQFGEYLAASVGTSYYNSGSNSGISYEAGIYVFFGILGFQVTHSPGFDDATWAYTISLRYF